MPSAASSPPTVPLVAAPTVVPGGAYSPARLDLVLLATWPAAPLRAPAAISRSTKRFLPAILDRPGRPVLMTSSMKESMNMTLLVGVQGLSSAGKLHPNRANLVELQADTLH